MEWRDNHFSKLKEERKEEKLLIEKKDDEIKILKTSTRKNIVVFTIAYIIFIFANLFFRELSKNINNEEFLNSMFTAQLFIYFLFIIAIYLYIKENSFSKKKIRYIYIWLFISFFIFPMILQIGIYIYIVSKETFYLEPIGKQKKEPINYQFKKTIIAFVSTVLLLFLTFSYFFGGYKLISEKYYSSKQFIIGLIFPPYTIYIGIDEILKDEQPKKEERSKAVKSFDNWIERKLNN